MYTILHLLPRFLRIHLRVSPKNSQSCTSSACIHKHVQYQKVAPINRNTNLLHIQENTNAGTVPSIHRIPEKPLIQDTHTRIRILACIYSISSTYTKSTETSPLVDPRNPLFPRTLSLSLPKILKKNQAFESQSFRNVQATWEHFIIRKLWWDNKSWKIPVLCRGLCGHCRACFRIM
jgi:hypothetical protein